MGSKDTRRREQKKAKKGGKKNETASPMYPTTSPMVEVIPRRKTDKETEE